MSKTTSDAAGNTQWQWPAFLVICAWLTSSILWRLLVTAHEYSMRREQLLTMALDGLLIIGLLATWRRIAVPDEAEVLRHFRDALFIVAFLAGIGLFVIRLTSTAAWWTGHLSYALEGVMYFPCGGA